MNKSRYMPMILALTILPSMASANAGTPLMWASMLHLVFGNAIIGLIEGLILARLPILATSIHYSGLTSIQN